MADRTPPPLPDLEPPRGAPVYAWFEGILDGARRDDAALESAVAELGRAGIGPVEVEFDGGRFTVLFAGGTFPGSAFGEDRKQEVLRAIEAVVAAADPSRSVESTTRCTEVHAESTVETLFAIEGSSVRPLGRVRPIESADRRRDPRRESEDDRDDPTFPRRHLLVIAMLGFVVGPILLWQSGWLDRIRAVDPSTLPIETTVFEHRLEVSVDRELGRYVFTVTRGPNFPGTREALDVWRDRIEADGDRPVDRVAHEILASGGRAYIHVLGEDDARLRTVPIELRSLVTGSLGEVVVKADGHPGTRRFVLTPEERWRP